LGKEKKLVDVLRTEEGGTSKKRAGGRKGGKKPVKKKVGFKGVAGRKTSIG